MPFLCAKFPTNILVAQKKSLLESLSKRFSESFLEMDRVPGSEKPNLCPQLLALAGSYMDSISPASLKHTSSISVVMGNNVQHKNMQYSAVIK